MTGWARGITFAGLGAVLALLVAYSPLGTPPVPPAPAATFGR